MEKALLGYLGLGSNLGDREEYFRRALTMLQATHGLVVKRLSNVYESRPWGYNSSNNYLNMVIEIEWVGSPLGLRQLCYRIEAALDRHEKGPSYENNTHVRYADRTIDIDILWLDDIVSDDVRLILPHPLAHERAFVLYPWHELTPGLTLNGRPIGQCLQELPQHEKDSVALLEGIKLIPVPEDHDT